MDHLLSNHFYFLRASGLCGAIFKKAGFELDEECNQIGHCNTGEAVITKGYAF